MWPHQSTRTPAPGIMKSGKHSLVIITIYLVSLKHAWSREDIKFTFFPKSNYLQVGLGITTIAIFFVFQSNKIIFKKFALRP